MKIVYFYSLYTDLFDYGAINSFVHSKVLELLNLQLMTMLAMRVLWPMGHGLNVRRLLRYL